MRYDHINWLASYPKSGNTWVRCFLQAYFTNKIDINELTISVQDDVAPAYQTGIRDDITRRPIDIQHLARPMALLRFVEQYNSQNLSIPLFIKTHSPNVSCNGIDMLPANLTRSVVYIVRDPRDVLPSYAKHMGVGIDVGLKWMTDKYRTLNPTEHRVADYISDWATNVDSYLVDKEHNVLIVKYEDMRVSPFKEFRRILTHLGIDPIDCRIRSAIELVELDKLRAKEKKEGFLESSPHAKDKFFGRGEVGSYVEKLSIKQINKIERKFYTVMKKLGYIAKKRAA